jgi:hypothetical protein
LISLIFVAVFQKTSNVLNLLQKALPEIKDNQRKSNSALKAVLPFRPVLAGYSGFKVSRVRLTEEPSFLLLAFTDDVEGKVPDLEANDLAQALDDWRVSRRVLLHRSRTSGI